VSLVRITYLYPTTHVIPASPPHHRGDKSLHWIAPAEKDAAASSLEKRLWDAADQFRANSGLKTQEYSGPILGLIFSRFVIQDTAELAV